MPETGSTYGLDFGPGYRWQGLYPHATPSGGSSGKLAKPDGDWTGTRVGARFTARGDATVVDFYHSGWRHANDHFRTSSCCWANYLRVLRRFVEQGERVPYDWRDDA